MAPRPLAYDRGGVHLVTADGEDLLVYSGETEGPAWQTRLSAPVVAVAVHGTDVLVLDGTGALTRFDRAGKKLDSKPLMPGGSALLLARDGTVAVPGPSSVAVVKPGRPAISVLPSSEPVVAAALSPSGSQLGVLTASGLRILDASSGSERRRVALEGRALAALDEARWLVARGSTLLLVGGDSRSGPFLDVPTEEPIDTITVSERGDLIGVTHGAAARIFAARNGEALARIRWTMSAISAVAFGPTPWFAVAIDHGDANKIDLVSADVHRTDPHPGRPRNRWLLDVQVARTKAAALFAAPASVVEQAAAPRRRLWVWVLIGFAAMALFCCLATLVVGALA